jgi:molecular chaperone HtpG
LRGFSTGEINIKIDTLNRSISVKDNGIGINPSDLPKLLCMFGTNKKTDEKTIGEKGVGLKFAMFSCNDFYILSGNEKGTSEAFVIDAFTWKTSVDEHPLDLIHDSVTDKIQGTTVILNNLPEIPILSLTLNQLKFVLRTRTAIGNTNIIWSNDDLDITVNLNFIDQNGIETNEKIPFKYWLPIENIDNNEKISIYEYQEYIKDDRTDSQKRLKLKNKIIYKEIIFDYKGRDIKAFACFVPKRKTWNDLTKAFNIATDEQLEDDIWMENYSYSTFQTGIFTSVKGMPTGISIEHPITGASGVDSGAC